METQSSFRQKFTPIALRAYALKALFSSLDMIGNQLILQKNCRGQDGPLSEAAYGPHHKQRINIFRPQGDQIHIYPVLIYFHGGGFIVGDKDGYDRVCRRLANYGYVTFNVNYRLAPKYRYVAQTQDVARAIDWVYRHAGDYGGDCRTIVLAGDSAGALHASWHASALETRELFDHVGVKQTIPRVALKGLLLFYGLYDFDTVMHTGFPFIGTYVRNFLSDDRDRPFAERAGLLSPIRYVTNTLPAMFLCSGEKDSLWLQSVQYAQALRNKGIKTRTLFLGKSVYPDAHHGFLYFADRQCTKRAFQEAARFLHDIAPTTTKLSY
jgi:acetyl esterase